MSGRTVLIGAALVALALVPSRAHAGNPTLGGRTPLGRFAQRPANQAGLDNTASVLETSFTWPANAINTVEFDYGVESEENYDFLEVYWVNAQNVATLLWKESGLKGGHNVLTLPSAGGQMKIRFRYSKDVSLSKHLDTAWVDNVEFKSSAAGSARQLTQFNSWGSGLPAGWTSSSSGFVGSWAVSQAPVDATAGRPLAQAGQANTSSYFERAVNFTSATNNYVSFDYFVDAAATDALRVYLDPAINPTPVWTISGLNQGGHALVNKVNGVPIASGAHTVRFEYAKGAGPSAGLDTARVDNVVMASGGNVLEVHTFSGRNLGVAPVQVANRGAEWTSGGSGGGWVAQPALPHKSYVPFQTAGQALFTGWSAFAAPVVDGQVAKQDYRNATAFKVRNDGDPALPIGQISMVASNDTRALYVGMHVKAATGAAGSESGTVTVYLDADHAQTLRGITGCGGHGEAPSANDRKLTVSYSIPAGGSTASVSVTQQKGNCAGWAALLSTDPVWPVQVAISEPSGDLGYLHLELQIGLPTTVLSTGKLGLGVKRYNTWGGIPLTERLPYADVAGVPADADIYTWETVNFGYSPGNAERGAPGGDGCCFPAPAQPGLRW